MKASSLLLIILIAIPIFSGEPASCMEHMEHMVVIIPPASSKKPAIRMEDKDTNLENKDTNNWKESYHLVNWKGLSIRILKCENTNNE